MSDVRTPLPSVPAGPFTPARKKRTGYRDVHAHKEGSRLLRSGPGREGQTDWGSTGGAAGWWRVFTAAQVVVAGSERGERWY